MKPSSILVAAMALAGCYDPTLKDCVVACATDGDCAHGQSCAAGGFCAGNGTACKAFTATDDARLDDAPSGADAPAEHDAHDAHDAEAAHDAGVPHDSPVVADTATMHDAALPPDAAPLPDAAVAHDASTPADAPPSDVTLVVTVQNKGQVVVTGGGTCTDPSQNSSKTCAFTVVDGATLTATAMATAGGHPFVQWTDPTCGAQGAACTFTAAAGTTIEAQFH